MKREILFRGLRTDGKGWVYGDLVQWKARGKCAILPQDGDEWNNPFDFEVRPETVGQFTGLHDKNGVKIWEGDVVKVHGRGGEFWTGASIAYHSPSFRLQKDLKICDEFRWDEWQSDFEVTGNIHEQ